MKLFVDTGDLDEVKKAAEWGVIDGVTTNPTLIAKTGKPFKEVVLKICELMPEGAISAEVVATDYDTMLKEALEISSWSPQIVVKVPLIENGVKLVSTLTDKGIRTNVTLVFSVTLVILAFTLALDLAGSPTRRGFHPPHARASDSGRPSLPSLAPISDPLPTLTLILA